MGDTVPGHAPVERNAQGDAARQELLDALAKSTMFEGMVDMHLERIEAVPEITWTRSRSAANWPSRCPRSN